MKPKNLRLPVKLKSRSNISGKLVNVIKAMGEDVSDGAPSGYGGFWSNHYG